MKATSVLRTLVVSIAVALESIYLIHQLTMTTTISTTFLDSPPTLQDTERPFTNTFLSDEICSINPGLDPNGEGSPLGYQILLRSQLVFPSQRQSSLPSGLSGTTTRTVKLACVWAMPNKDDTAEGPTPNLWVETVGQLCDDAWLALPQASAEATAASAYRQFLDRTGNNDNDTTMQNGKEDWWLYFWDGTLGDKAYPDHYLIVSNVKHMIERAKGTDPNTSQNYDTRNNHSYSTSQAAEVYWPASRLTRLVDYRSLRGGPSTKVNLGGPIFNSSTTLCQTRHLTPSIPHSRILNRAAIVHLLSMVDVGTDYLSVSNDGIVCRVPWYGRKSLQPWQYVKWMAEVPLPLPTTTKVVLSPITAAMVDHSLRRIHAVCTGVCDVLWNAAEQKGSSTDGWNVKALVAGTTKAQSPPDFVDSSPSNFCLAPLGEGDEGKAGVKGLLKIRHHLERMSKEKDTETHKNVLCMVYTHSGRHAQLRSVAETWAPKCDGFFAASNASDPSIGAINLRHEGRETYQNMWLKVRAMFRYAYDHFLEDFDFFHIGGDDHYVIVENLRHTISNGNWKGPWNQSEPLYLGGSLPLDKHRRYCNGGSGYTINRSALRLLVENLFPTASCWPHWEGSDEDMLIANCFRSVGIQCMDTNDHLNETRYHTWHVDQHAKWSVGKPAQGGLSLVHQGIAWKEGLGQISETSVSFHLKREDPLSADSGMRRYHAIVYNMCKNTTEV